MILKNPQLSLLQADLQTNLLRIVAKARCFLLHVLVAVGDQSQIVGKVKIFQY